MKKGIAFFCLVAVCLGGIGLIFWKQEIKYTLPTPVPENLIKISEGDSVQLPFPIDNPNVFIHFYNFDCPCSRFNIREFESMVHRFNDSVEFVAVLQADTDDRDAAAEFREKYDMGIRIIDDPEGKIAASLGVYSTPQAVLVKDGKLFFKGNYNRARFCVSRNTKFAEMALDAMINNQMPPLLPEIAYLPYGCELPSNTESQNIFINLFN